MKEKTILNKLRTLLGMEVKLEQMKLSDGETILETDSFETGVFADNQAPEVFIITTDEQKVPLPIGDYELEDGRMLVVKVEGKIAEIKEVPTQEEQAPMEQPTAEVPVEASSNPAPTKEPKSVIETTTREVRFSDEEKEKLKTVFLSGDLSISAYLELPVGVHKVGNDTITVAEKDVPNWDGNGTHKEKYIVSIIPNANANLKKENAELKALLTEISEHPKVTELAEQVKPIVHNPENKTNKIAVDLSKADKKTRLINLLNNI